ncbi:hypothetical protein ANMWB30_24070 [Arthrobacter sp. MWB30]|nr:hypothetical protein ANMWB30_24070 [Arthrobacter sp. MWB30]
MIPAHQLLALLSHVDQLRNEVQAVHRFIGDQEVEDTGLGAAPWAWNQILEELQEVLTLDPGENTPVDQPLITRTTEAERTLEIIREMAQAQDKHGHIRRMNPKNIIALIDVPVTADHRVYTEDRETGIVTMHATGKRFNPKTGEGMETLTGDERFLYTQAAAYGGRMAEQLPHWQR